MGRRDGRTVGEEGSRPPGWGELPRGLRGLLGMLFIFYRQPTFENFLGSAEYAPYVPSISGLLWRAQRMPEYAGVFRKEVMA